MERKKPDNMQTKGLDSIHCNKKTKMFALLMNHTSIEMKYIVLISIFTLIMELSIVLDKDIIKIWKVKAGSPQLVSMNNHRMIVFNLIEFLSQFGPHYFISSISFTYLVFIYILILLTVVFLCVILYKPSILLNNTYFEVKQQARSSTLLTVVAHFVANYQFLFLFCNWLLFQSIPCTDLSLEQRKEYQESGKSLLNTFENTVIQNQTPSKSSCLSYKIYCYQTNHITLMILNLLILPFNISIRLYMDKMVKFAPDPLLTACKRSISDFLQIVFITSVLMVKVVLYLGGFSNESKLTFFVYYIGIFLVGLIGYTSKKPVYFDRTLSMNSTIRYVVYLCLVVAISQIRSTSISFTINNYVVLISCLLFFSIATKLVKDSSEKERFKLNLNSNEDILQSLYYVLKYSKQHGSPPSHNDDMIQSTLDYRHHSKLLKDYYYSLQSKMNIDHTKHAQLQDQHPDNRVHIDDKQRITKKRYQRNLPEIKKRRITMRRSR